MSAEREDNAPLLRNLSAMLIHLNAMQAQLDSDEINTQDLRTELSVLEQMTRDLLHQIRLSADEEPLVSLPEALSRLVEETAEQLGLSSRIIVSGIDEQRRGTLPTSAERLLYLVVREALYQVQRHSGTRRLRLSLNYGRDDVQLSIEDDGEAIAEADYDAPAPPLAVLTEATTLASPVVRDLRYRLAQVGGTLEVGTAGEKGTRFMARIPYESALPEAAPAARQAPSRPQQTAPEGAEEVTILLVDSQAVTRAGLHRLLEGYPGLRIVGEAADGVQAVSETLELGPNVVLMDALLPNGQSLEALRQIKQLNLATRVLLLSNQEREEYLYETLRAGADGYVLKDIDPSELVEAVRTVARGEVLVQPQLANRLLSRFGRQGRAGNPYETLTTRELEVLRQLARGLRNKEIAARLFVSERTVNFHLANIYQKLNVSGRTEALSRAMELGLITA